MFGQRGQGAMEYLMTYGWAILVVMIVGIVMWQIGIFNMGSTAVSSSGFAKFKPILQAACKVTTDGTFYCMFTNGAGAAATINHVSLSSGGNSYSVESPLPGDSVGVEDNIQVSATGLGEGVAGQPYSIDVEIAYTLIVSGEAVDHTDQGTIKGPYEIVSEEPA